MIPSPGQIVEEASGRRIDLPELCVIGRNASATIVIDDPRTSRRHALIRQQADGYWFFDLGSVNGSRINGRRVTTAQRLKNGDRIAIGERVFRFEGAFEHPSCLTTCGNRTIAAAQPARATLLVSDIWGFTSLSQRLTPDALAQVIGSWYSLTSEILSAANATVDKFIGDCVLAYWLDTSPETRRVALETTGEMRNSCRFVQERHQAALASLDRPFRAGLSLHCGKLVYGAFSAQAFTMIGDAVNVAFRLEGLTRTLDEPILVSSEFLDGWEEGRAGCRRIGPRTVKGRDDPIEVWAPVSDR